jgi:hypothetical protein
MSVTFKILTMCDTQQTLESIQNAVNISNFKQDSCIQIIHIRITVQIWIKSSKGG